MAYSFPNSPLWMICPACAVHCIQLWSRRSWRMPNAKFGPLDQYTKLFQSFESIRNILHALETQRNANIPIHQHEKWKPLCCFCKKIIAQTHFWHWLHQIALTYKRLHLCNILHGNVYFLMMCIFMEKCQMTSNDTCVKKWHIYFDRITFLSKY